MSYYYAGAYWGARKESSGECAARLSHCLVDLAAVDSTFSGWHKKGAIKAAALAQPVDTASLDVLLELLNSGRNRRDIGNDVIEDLGFSAALWNRADNPTAFNVKCGAYADSPSVKNAFVLQLPEFSGASEAVGARSSARAVVEALTEAWDPDWATWTSDVWRSRQKVDVVNPVFGLVTYVARKSVREVPVPGVHVEPFLNGTLFIFDAERDEVNGDHLTVLQEAVGVM